MTEEEAKIFHHRQRTEFLNELKYRQTKQGSFESHLYHLDHPLIMGNGPLLESSDEGKGAATIRSACEETPRWRTLWNRARRKLTPNQRRILDALLVDTRSHPAARIAHTTQPTVDLAKKKFKKIFAQCFQAWKRDFGQN